MKNKLTVLSVVILVVVGIIIARLHARHSQVPPIHPGALVFRYMTRLSEDFKRTHTSWKYRVQGCTVAYILHKYDHVYVVTAGHCFYHTPRKVGSAVYMKIDNKSHVVGRIVALHLRLEKGHVLLQDSMIVELNSQWQHSATNYSPALQGIITGVLSSGEVKKLSKDTVVYKLGVSSHLQEGRILDIHPTTFITSTASLPGDSGGPLVIKNKSGNYSLIGLNNLHVHGSTTQSIATYTDTMLHDYDNL